MSDDVVQDEYDVFLVHSDCNSDRDIAQCIQIILKRNNLSCVTSEDGGGAMLIEGTLNMIKRTGTTLVLLTSKSFDSPWLKIDVIVALEKAVQIKKAFVRLLVEGDRREEFKKLGLLGRIPYLIVDFNRSDWDKELLNELQKSPESLDNPLPAGNLALGQVYSVVVGYYGTVLRSLCKVLKEQQTVKENLSTTSTRFFILIPSDCKVLNLLTQCKDSRIKTEDNICVNTVTYCGKERPYDVNLYRITDGGTAYYFVGEVPNVLNTISVLHKNKVIAEVDLPFEVDRFLWTLQSVLTHSKHMDCKDTFHVIKVEAEFLVNTVLTQIKKDVSGIKDRNATCHMTSQAELINFHEEQKKELDAAIVFDEDNSSDKSIALNISKVLSARGLKVSFEEPNKRKFEILGRARWKILILSGKTRLKPYCIVSLTDSIDNNKMGVIPVLNGLLVKDIPEFMSWMSCISTNENYIESLLHILNGEELQVDHCLPRGNVYTGLVWGYILNYLPIPLLGKAVGSDIQPVGLDITSRIKNILRDNNITYGCIKRLYICVPKSCEDRTFENVSGVAKVGELDAVTVGKRPYRLAMYRIVLEDLPSGPICFLAEQPAPTRHLLEMSKLYRDVGVSSQDLHNQSEEFCKSCAENIGSKGFIQNVGDLNSLCHFLFYDDETYDPDGPLSILRKALKAAIITDFANHVEVVYS